MASVQTDTNPDTALVIHAKSDLRADAIQTPAPGADEVRLTMAWGGICGSDLHYFLHGGVGASVVRDPMVLGHEVSGTVERVGADVSDFKPGDAVAIHPAQPCLTCPECQADRRHLCRNTRFLGSAAHRPHTNGGFRTHMIVKARQLRHLPPGLDLQRAAMAEPFSVALHAVARAGDVRGKSTFVQGAGPIGALIVAALKHKGAARIVVSDLQDFPLEIARKLGADEGWNAGQPMPEEEFDVVFEATGVGAALPGAIARTRRGGILVQVGMFPPGDVAVPLAQIISREIDYRGTFRFDHEFDDALTVLAQRPQIFDVLVTHRFDLSSFEAAFAIAGDRRCASKVLLNLQA